MGMAKMARTNIPCFFCARAIEVRLDIAEKTPSRLWYCTPVCRTNDTKNRALARFLRSLLPQDPVTKCIEHSKATPSHMGYGRFWIGSRRILAHRFSYEHYVGDIPDGLCVLHKCDNPACVNIEHLFLGTHQENMTDRDKKGRFVTLRGSQNGSSILNEDDVREIRQKIKSGATDCTLGKEYGVTAENISHIRKNKTWRHVE